MIHPGVLLRGREKYFYLGEGKSTDGSQEVRTIMGVNETNPRLPIKLLSGCNYFIILLPYYFTNILFAFSRFDNKTILSQINNFILTLTFCK